MKKSIALLIVALLVLPALSFLAPVRASTGAPVLAAVNDAGDIIWAINDIDVKAGSEFVTAVDGVPVAPDTWKLTIVFNVNGTDLLTWSGAQFALVFGLTGLAQYDAETDVIYASYFQRSFLTNTSGVEVNITNPLLKNGYGVYTMGTMTTNDGSTIQYLMGPMAFDIIADLSWIKILDGASTLTAVAAQAVNILPSFNITPTYGPGGYLVCLAAVALEKNTLYNITYSNATTAAAQVMSGADGKFTFCWNIKDLCTAYYDSDNYNETIYIDIWKNSTSAFVDEVWFTEMYRVLDSISSSTGTWNGPYGNYSDPYPLYGYNAKVLDDLTIQGSWFNPSGPVTVYIGTTNVGSVTPVANGTFEITVTVPILPNGLVNVTLDNVGCKFIFTINIIPTLIVTPDHGPIGTTVDFTAYGFPENTEVTLWWFVNYACDFECRWIAIMNATVDGTGSFNVTTTYVVPKQFGGPHEIVATYATDYNCTDDPWYFGYIADTYFTVTPTLVVTPSTFDLDGTTFWVNGSGFDPLLAYTINVDNQAYAAPTSGYMFADWWWGLDIYFDGGFTAYPQGWIGDPSDHFVVSDECGDIAIELVKAGFQPGLHSVALTAANYNDYWYYWNYGMFYYPMNHDYWFTPANGDYAGVYWMPGSYPTDVYATFTVTAVGNPIVENITTQLNTLNAHIVSIQGDIATLQTDVGQIQVAVAALNAKVTNLQGDVATVQTTLGTMQGTLTTISGNTATILTDVGAIKADVSAMKPFLPVDMMPVWIAVIFAIIAAIASIYGVLVIRSKIAQ